jgi:hypothetical protein
MVFDVVVENLEQTRMEMTILETNDEKWDMKLSRSTSFGSVEGS